MQHKYLNARLARPFLTLAPCVSVSFCTYTVIFPCVCRPFKPVFSLAKNFLAALLTPAHAAAPFSTVRFYAPVLSVFTFHSYYPPVLFCAPVLFYPPPFCTPVLFTLPTSRVFPSPGRRSLTLFLLSIYFKFYRAFPPPGRRQLTLFLFLFILNVRGALSAESAPLNI